MKKLPSAVAFGVIAGLLLWTAGLHPTWAAEPSAADASETIAPQNRDENDCDEKDCDEKDREKKDREKKDREKKDREKKDKETVQLIVDYGDGVKKQFHQISWQDKMTVQDVTLAAAKHPRGIQIKQQGKSATAFLSQIDDLANNARGRSWVYRVNGKLADRSFGVFVVKAGDIVTWSYQQYP